MTFSEFSADRQQLVGGANLDADKTTFASAFAAREEFVAGTRIVTRDADR